MGLYYFGARYYDPATGVWLTQDVYRGEIEQPLTLHRTLYVGANPVNNVDAYGYAVIANGYGGSGGGSGSVSPQQPAPPNPARPDNYPYEWKHERDEERFESSGGGGGRDEPEDEMGDLPRWLLDSRGLWGGPEVDALAGPTLEEVLAQIEVLEGYYDNATVAALVVRKIFEPEWYWPLAIPSTWGLAPDDLYPPPDAIAQQIAEGAGDPVGLDYYTWMSWEHQGVLPERQEAIAELNRLFGCDIVGGLGCQDDPPGAEQASLVYVEGRGYVQLTHVFVGLAAHYSPSILTELKLYAPATTSAPLPGMPTMYPREPIEMWSGMGKSMATALYIGDTGGAVADYLLDQEENPITWHYGQEVHRGDRPDLEGDIDAYAVAAMLEADPDMRISEALRTYYLTDDEYYHTRWQRFESDVLGLPPSGEDTSARQQIIADQVVSFAHLWVAKSQPSLQTIFTDFGRASAAWEMTGMLIEDVREQAELERSRYGLYYGGQ